MFRLSLDWNTEKRTLGDARSCDIRVPFDGTAYCVRVRAERRLTKSAPSRVVTAGTPFSGPRELQARALSPTEVEVDWFDLSWAHGLHAADPARHYELERADEGGAFARIATARAGNERAAARDRGLRPGATYTYRVRAIRGAEASGYTLGSPVRTPWQPAGSASATARSQSGDAVQVDPPPDETALIAGSMPFVPPTSAPQWTRRGLRTLATGVFFGAVAACSLLAWLAERGRRRQPPQADRAPARRRRAGPVTAALAACACAAWAVWPRPPAP